MNKKERIEHKKGNQERRERLLSLYYKTSPSKMGWIPNPGFIQRGRYSTLSFPK